MPTTVTCFPVDNGDMTLVRLGDAKSTTLLVDCNIRSAADDEDGDKRNVAQDLRALLSKDSNGRPYVDAFLLTHPDNDHCRGLENHFFLGALEDYEDDDKQHDEKHIVIGEMWSSPIVFRRASRDHKLCADAVAFQSEAKRRVELYREAGEGSHGDRILILGEDIDGKTDNLEDILVRLDETFHLINGNDTDLFEATLLAPLPSSDEEEEEGLSKNHSSSVLNLQLAGEQSKDHRRRMLVTGDADVLVWEKLWAKFENATTSLEYDLLIAPHHCSWHSLSWDSRSEKGDDAKVSEAAKSALSQANKCAVVVASSRPIKDDDCDPPSHAAREVYQDILSGQAGKFVCTGEYPREGEPKPMHFVIGKDCLKPSGGGDGVLEKGLLDETRSDSATRHKGGNTRYASGA